MPDTKPDGRNRDLTAANRARMRRRQERLAADLRSHGWVVLPPEDAELAEDVIAVRTGAQAW